MRLLIRRKQPIYGDMGINLRRSETSVTKQFLNGPQVSTTIKEVSCGTMAHCVWSNWPVIVIHLE